MGSSQSSSKGQKFRLTGPTKQPTPNKFLVFPEPTSQSPSHINPGPGFPSKCPISSTSSSFESHPLYKKHNCTELLQGSKFTSTNFTSTNGFVQTVLLCYCHHHNLTLRPDDIWTSILTQFSFYLNKHSEKFRGKFVSFSEGKKELEVFLPGSLRSADYSQFVHLISDKIHENLVDPEVRLWVLPSFSTTTPEDLISCGVVLMATMKNFFSYSCILYCGIPYITLEGTLADWEEILRRLEKLKEYELEDWYQMLRPILSQFIQAKKGKVDLQFWQQICDYKSGSGEDYISGWITAFCVFDEDGNWGGEIYSRFKHWPNVDLDKIPSGIVQVDVKINDNGTEHKSVMFAGHVGHQIVNKGYGLKPTVGWAICLID